MNRDKPELYKMELEEGEEKPPLQDFYTDECNVKFIEYDGTTLALDFDDPSIMVDHEGEIHRMNLLYARKHLRKAYDLWFDWRGKIKC